MSVRVIVGDALGALKCLPDESVHCAITSPPYWGLRSYKGESGMIGLEPTFDEHLENLVAVFCEVRRVLRKDGTLWLNYGDAYANDGKWGGSTGGKHVKGLHGQTGIGRTKVVTGLKPKDLLLMPARVALALQEDGWWLRSEIIWHKPNPMPESVRDRPTCAHEKLFLFSRSARYFYDGDAVRTTSERMHGHGLTAWATSQGHHGNDPRDQREPSGGDRLDPSVNQSVNQKGKAALRNVWTIATHGFKDAHFATFPPKLVEPCIKAGTSEHGCCADCGAPWERIVERTNGVYRPGTKAKATRRTLNATQVTPAGVTTKGFRATCECGAEAVPAVCLDPFAGSGTTAIVADRLGRDAILIEISPEYARMAQRRIRDDNPMFAQVERS